MDLKTAIIQEWLVSYAGSEKVVESFNNIYKDADIYSIVDLLNDEDREIILKGKHAHTSFIQKLPFAGSKHRNYLYLFPFAIEQFDLTDYDLIISSSHAVAKGVLTNYKQLHISYCHTPMRYAWDQYHSYLKETNLTGGIKGWFVKRVLHYLRMWDLTTVNRVDYFIANSNHIKKRIKKIYNRDADVIYPPVDINNFEVESNKEEFYITASRLVPYKRVDLIVEAFSQLPHKKLVVIGDGTEMNKVKSKAGSNVEILGYQPLEELRKYMQKAKAFIFAAEEDFGIIPVEAMACGTPVIALNKGGAVESVIQDKTGVLFRRQDPDTIAAAIKQFETKTDLFDPLTIRKRAEEFSRDIFEGKIKDFVNKKSDKFFNE